MQRAAELAVINEIGEALAEQLDFQAIIELVGDRIRSIFDVDGCRSSRCTTRRTDMSDSRTRSTAGERFPRDQMPLGMA